MALDWEGLNFEPQQKVIRPAWAVTGYTGRQPVVAGRGRITRFFGAVTGSSRLHNQAT